MTLSTCFATWPKILVSSGAIAQLVERCNRTAKATGSNPVSSTTASLKLTVNIDESPAGMIYGCHKEDERMWFLFFAHLAFAKPIEIALKHVRHCEQENKEDLETLISLLEPESFIDLRHQFLNTRLQEWKALVHLKRQEAGSFVLETGIEKCLGLLQESTDLLLSVHSWADLHPTHRDPKDHDISVLKYLLLSLVLLMPDLSKAKDATLTFLYRQKVGESDSRFVWNGYFHIPNCGYVFGGILESEPCRGLDCSSFVGDCIGFPGRLTTLFLHQKWVELSNWCHHEKGPFIKLAREELEPGDLVFWRHKKGGHVVLFHFWLFYPLVYQGIEATRRSNAEGIRITRLRFEISHTSHRCLRYHLSPEEDRESLQSVNTLASLESF
jgi:hypothetical protein